MLVCAVRIGPDLRMAVVGAPSYLERFGRPATRHELTRQRCINIRLPTVGGLYAWEYEKEGRVVNVRVDGAQIVNDVEMVVQAAQDGLALACVLEDQATAHLAGGRLVRVLEDWCPFFPGYHLYYPDRRQLPAAFTLLVNALRYKARWVRS
jgi:DNA-binding transcriptional LysR family regulator